MFVVFYSIHQHWLSEVFVCVFVFVFVLVFLLFFVFLHFITIGCVATNILFLKPFSIYIKFIFLLKVDQYKGSLHICSVIKIKNLKKLYATNSPLLSRDSFYIVCILFVYCLSCQNITIYRELTEIQVD